MPRTNLGKNVFDVAIDRMYDIYKEGHRVVVSFSAGKDSTVCLEICIIAATMAGRLPVEAVIRDEEIMFPGTYEFLERTNQRSEIKLNHLCTRHAISNVFNRADPFWWTHDPRLSPDQWMREPPSYAIVCDEADISRMTIPERFPPAEGKSLIAVMGLRASESTTRYHSIFSAKGHLTKENKWGVRNCRPIYDWKDTDIWKAIKDNKWDYNEAYNVLYRMGEKASRLRIAPPTLNSFGADQLMVAMRAWPRWFDKVCKRVPGIRTVAQYGKKAVTPKRRLNESWKDVFERECIGPDVPDFVRERSLILQTKLLREHAHHSTTEFPEVSACKSCPNRVGSWKAMTRAMYNGDPLASKTGTRLPNMEELVRHPWLNTPGLEWMRGDNLTYAEWKCRSEKYR